LEEGTKIIPPCFPKTFGPFGCMSNLIIGHMNFFKNVCHHFRPRLMVRKDNMIVYYDQYMSFQLPWGLKHLTFARLDMLYLSH
jgi:hypothetical protein